MSKKRKRKKKGLGHLIRKHKAASVVIGLFLACILVVGGVIGTIAWNLYHDSIGVVDADDVDTLVEIDGYGQSKLGHTFAYGGVGLTINTINKQFDLDIQDYIIVNFENLVGIIDELGGIPVKLTEEEAEYYRQTGMPDINAGTVTLTGSQALAHARNRSLDNDFGRTGRQRDVLYGIYKKVMEKKDPAAILSLINYCMTQVSTNMGVNELYSIATDVLNAEHLTTQTAAVPKDGTYEFGTYDSMSVLNIDLEANKEYIQELLY